MVFLWVRSAAARLLALRVRIPPAALTFVSCGCALLGRGLCEGPILVHSSPTECLCVSLCVMGRCRRRQDYFRMEHKEIVMTY
jgi:hypothetical protein